MVKALLPLPSWNCLCSHLEAARSHQPWGFPIWPDFVTTCRQVWWPCIGTGLLGKGQGGSLTAILVPSLLNDSVTAPTALPQAPAEDMGLLRSIRRSMPGLWILLVTQKVIQTTFLCLASPAAKQGCRNAHLLEWCLVLRWWNWYSV